MRRRVFLVVLAVGVVALASCADASSVGARPSDADPAISDLLEVRCDGTSTEVLTPQVQAQADGVHVLIHNTDEVEVLTQWEGGGDGAEPGDSTQLIAIPPGEARFRCLELSPDVDPGQSGGWGTFEVLQPPGWVSPFLECESGSYSGHHDYVPDARGTDDPHADARQHAKGAEVVQAGYNTRQGRTYVAIVDDRVTKTFEYFADGHGGWLLGETGGCSD